MGDMRGSGPKLERWDPEWRPPTKTLEFHQEGDNDNEANDKNDAVSANHCDNFDDILTYASDTTSRKSRQHDASTQTPVKKKEPMIPVSALETLREVRVLEQRLQNWDAFKKELFASHLKNPIMCKQVRPDPRKAAGHGETRSGQTGSSRRNAELTHKPDTAAPSVQKHREIQRTRPAAGATPGARDSTPPRVSFKPQQL